MQTASNCVLVGFLGENCKCEGMCRLQEIVYWCDCGGRIVSVKGSADCKKLCTGAIEG